MSADDYGYAVIRDGQQTGPDTWEPRTRILRLAPSTPVDAIKAWYYTLYPYPYNDAHIELVFCGEPKPAEVNR